MEDRKQISNAKEEGKRVWSALADQFAEGAGFFGAMFASLANFLRKNIAGLALFGFVFALAGGLYAYLQRPVIQAEMTVSYAQLEKKIYADMLAKLDQLRGSGQTAVLASTLGITEQQAALIARIDSRNIHNEPLVKDISTEKVPFYVVVDVYDAAVLPALQQALVKYINEPPFVKARLKLNEQNYLNEIAMIKQQMLYMDSLKSYLVRDLKNSGSGAVASLNNLNKSQNELFSRIRDLEGALRFNQNIEVMDGFVGHAVPWKKRLLPPALMGLVIGAGIRLVWLMFR
jgi:hypothetical protein